jgi:hypothetical protein
MEEYDELEYKSERISWHLVTDLLLAEHALRELTQWEEKLHHSAMALQKAVDIESNQAQPVKATAIESTTAQLEKANQQLRQARLQGQTKE